MFHQPSADSGMIFDPRLPVPLQIDRSWFDDLAGRLDKGGPWGDYRLAQLAVEGEKSRLVTSFEELQCLKHLGGLSPPPSDRYRQTRIVRDVGPSHSRR